MYGKSGYVCDDNFGIQSANVACKELGFPLGAVEIIRNSNLTLSQNDAIYLMDNVRCLGNESTLRECRFNGWGIHNCGIEEVRRIMLKDIEREKYMNSKCRS